MGRKTIFSTHHTCAPCRDGKGGSGGGGGAGKVPRPPAHAYVYDCPVYYPFFLSFSLLVI